MNRARTHGLSAEAHRKNDLKYDKEAEREAISWIADVLGDEKLKECQGRENVQPKLKDGVILCNLMNTIKEGAIKKVHPGTSNSFKQMENIGNFLKAAENYGCIRDDLFQTVDLTDNINMVAVIGAIYALGRKANQNGWSGAQLGPKEATANPREFTEEQLMEGRVKGY